MAKYRAVFIDEATDHLAEISSALLELEKEPDSAAAIDLIFRMAHSIKGMAASLSFDSITEVSHRLEDRMQQMRSVGRITDPEELGLLFRGLEGLEAMVAAVRETGESPPAKPELVAILAQPAATAQPAAAGDAKKKALSPAL